MQLRSVMLEDRHRAVSAGRPRAGTPRWVIRAPLVALTLVAVQFSARPPVAAAAGPAYPVESGYSTTGTFATATEVVTNAANGERYRVYRPADYAAVPFPSPIVTWGNGTNASPDMYSVLLGALASRGFTVVAPIQPNTGSGLAIAAAARFLITQNTTVQSVFQGHLDPGRIAAVGHSQGAGGAVRAATGNPSLIDTVVTFSLPNRGWVSANADCPTKNDCLYDVTRLSQPTLFVGTHGGLDSLIASTSTEQAFYRQVPGHAALALIQNSAGARADHNTIQNSGAPTGFLGYVTAWLSARLRDDPAAAAAFSGAHPELVGNTNWPGSAAR